MARGIAEADSVDIAANAHAATPISNRRFIFAISWAPRYRGEDAMIREPIGSAFKVAAADLGGVRLVGEPDVFLQSCSCNRAYASMMTLSALVLAAFPKVS